MKKKIEKKLTKQGVKEKDAGVQAIRTLVRAREDFQSMRKRMDNRLGRKANGEEQNIQQRNFASNDLNNFEMISNEAKRQEQIIEKMLLNALKQFPIYNKFLLKVKGIGPISSGWIIGEFDIRIATTVSKLWQFSGLNPGMVRGQKRVDNEEDGTFTYVKTDQLVPGDKLTPEFVAPFNKRLRTALVGVMADSFIKSKNDYYLNFYLPYKARLENEDSVINRNGEKKKWKEVSKGRRDRAAKRYMIKMFLKDLYAVWCEIEGLPVRVPYAEEYLGRDHAA